MAEPFGQRSDEESPRRRGFLVEDFAAEIVYLEIRKRRRVHELPRAKCDRAPG